VTTSNTSWHRRFGVVYDGVYRAQLSPRASDRPERVIAYCRKVL
jgi:hypothetical protein